MSVRPVSIVETFCTIMSTLPFACATTLKIDAALPGTSGTPATVTLASLRSAATPVMIASSTASPSLVSAMMVPGLLANDDRTCSLTP